MLKNKWQWFLAFSSVGWLAVTSWICVDSWVQNTQLRMAFENARFFEAYKYLPWYMWVAIGYLMICMVIGFCIGTNGKPDRKEKE